MAQWCVSKARSEEITQMRQEEMAFMKREWYERQQRLKEQNRKAMEAMRQRQEAARQVQQDHPTEREGEEEEEEGNDINGIETMELPIPENTNGTDSETKTAIEAKGLERGRGPRAPAEVKGDTHRHPVVNGSTGYWPIHRATIDVSKHEKTKGAKRGSKTARRNKMAVIDIGVPKDDVYPSGWSLKRNDQVASWELDKDSKDHEPEEEEEFQPVTKLAPDFKRNEVNYKSIKNRALHYQSNSLQTTFSTYQSAWGNTAFPPRPKATAHRTVHRAYNDKRAQTARAYGFRPNGFTGSKTRRRVEEAHRASMQQNSQAEGMEQCSDLRVKLQRMGINVSGGALESALVNPQAVNRKHTMDDICATPFASLWEKPENLRPGKPKNKKKKKKKK